MKRHEKVMNDLNTNRREIMRMCNKTQKYYHNFFNFDSNIGMDLEMIIQLNKNFLNLSYPVLTTTQNDKKLHIFYFNSLFILSKWTYHTSRDMYR